MTASELEHSSPTWQSRIKSIVQSFLLILCSLFVGFILCEILMRILDFTGLYRLDRTPILSDGHQNSSHLGYLQKPNSQKNCGIGESKATCYSNSMGIRNEEVTRQKPENTCRIEAIGDSMTQGLGVEIQNSYPKQLERLLHNTQKKTQVINMGMSAYGPPQYYYMYTDLGKALNPDLVLVGFFYKNDALDSYTYSLIRNRTFLKGIPDTVIPYSVHEWLKHHSYFWLAILKTYYGLIQKNTVIFERDVITDKQINYQVEIAASADYMKKGWEITENMLSKLVATAKKNDTPVLFIGIPSRFQIVPEAWKEKQKQGMRIDERIYTNQASRKLFLDICKQHSWQCLDLQQAFRDQPDTKKLFLSDDVHLTTEGNAVIAQEVAQKIQEAKACN